jgi:hypothetical protein
MTSGIYFIIECSPFHVDDHGFEPFDMFEFRNVLNLFNVGSVGASSENCSDETTIFAWRDIRTSHECSHRVVDNSRDMHRELPLVDFSLKDFDDIFTDCFLHQLLAV